MASDPDPEGEGNARRFKSLLGRVLSVSKDELTKREAAYKRSRRATKRRHTRTAKT
jgi:hypothetical protein